ncbi:TonB-dependent receptor [Thioalkalivibrio nitratireducens DSM 14787]|uniref:TonB-dependent receptor n=1 Tax=Thioalkalivibrio nitratireducens (strain DSM 14787 / UNIQEM 213 / ALEN2) TaxID=1255043 RepID=L0E195_THIND|nr:TonB-dependent receptor [Thioalkalivibrio nitratireducens]AGA34386.1 TonB-dependent receptor [Thioalkalivibrio nitratireducens DSM 14787]
MPRHCKRIRPGWIMLGLTVPWIPQAIAGERLDEVTVTGTREAQAVEETPAAVSVIDASEIAEARPTHPSELMSRVPGVHVNVTGGEGHMTAIRQPITTAPVYLFLEDGIPTRSTGFFNHNALYEVNLPQAGGVEVLRGPGTALYGSDAIGGVVNVLTRPAPLHPEAEVQLDVGEHGYTRLMGSAGNTWDSDGLRADLNLTRTDGWRDGTGYDRQSLNLRWDRFLDSGAVLKTVIAGSRIDQDTAGSSRLSREDYEQRPTRNYTPISFRKVGALRASTAYERETADSLLSVTSYLRQNTMDLMPNWTLNFDPYVSETENLSAGLLLRHRRDFEPMRTRVIVGADFDYSPGSRVERRIETTRDGRVFTDYTVGERIYDYDVTFMSASPYVHLESSPSEHLRLSAGLRYDRMRYDYKDRLDTPPSERHRRPESTQVDFESWSPKLGATYAFHPRLSGFAAYRHAFRAPSEGQLFRPGTAVGSVDLDPVKADSYELGLRGRIGEGMDFEFTLYQLDKRDDIVRFTDTATGVPETTNAGRTRHRGVEVGVGSDLGQALRLDVALSHSRHTFEEWSPRTGLDFAGNEMSSAPRLVASTRLGYRPAWLQGLHGELEWERVGRYWMDDENTTRYRGHDLVHLRMAYRIGDDLEVFGRVHNLTDERYATASAFTQARGEELAPGLPRTVYAGVRYRFQ